MPRWILVAPAVVVLALLAGVARPGTTAADEPLTVDDIASGLMCQCGCSMTVATCEGVMTCGIAPNMKASIQTQIDEGKTKKEIEDAFVAAYGETVLAVPRKSGFNLTAWVTPFLAIIAAAGVTAWVAWVWVRRRPPKAPEMATEERQLLKTYESQVERDLRQLE